MQRAIVVMTVAVLAISSFASAANILVDFETATDTNLFVGGGTFSRVAGHGGDVGKLASGNGNQSRKYSPAGVDYLMGAGTISADVDVYYDDTGTHGTAGYQGGLMLQAKTVNSEQYVAYLKVNASVGTVQLIVGNLKATNHTASVTVSAGTFTPNTTTLADIGWYNLSAVVSIDGVDNYKLVVTATDPSLNTYTATYIDTGTARYTTPGQVGLYDYCQWGGYACYDNFQIAPAPVPAVTDLVAGNPDWFKLVATWTYPTTIPASPVARWDLRYSTAPIVTEADFTAATPAAGVPTPTTPGAVQTCTITTLAASTQYWFAIKGFDAVGNAGPLSNIAIGTTGARDVVAPAAVTNLAASNLMANRLTLSWSDSGDDGMIGQAVGYELRYSTSPISEATWSSATLVTGTPVIGAPGTAQTFTLHGLTAGTTYSFAIKYKDEASNSAALSNVVTVSTPPADLTPPTAVADLKCAAVQSNKATLTWTAPTDYGAGGAGPFPAAGYDLRYSTAPISEANWAAAVRVTGLPTPAAPGTKETFGVTGLAASTTYYFAIKSFDLAEPTNFSALSNLLSGATMAPILPVTVRNPWLVSDRVADTHNITTIGATYGNAYSPDGVVPGTTEEQKAINLYNNQKRRLYHWTDEPPSLSGNSISDPTYNHNVFGWSLCGRQANMACTIANAVGFVPRFITIPGHNIYEVQYSNGTWHFYDTMTTMYVFTKTNPPHVASIDEISTDHSLMLNAVADKRACPGYLLCGDTPDWYVDAADHWSTSGNGIQTTKWTGNMDLRMGQAFKRTWESWLSQHPPIAGGGTPPYHHEASKDWKDTVNFPYWEPYSLTSAQSSAVNVTYSPTYRRWSNGTDTLAPDFQSAAYQSMLESASHDIATCFEDGLAPDLHTKTVGTTGEAIFKINVPFYITDANFSGDFVKTNAGDICSVFVSSNGTSWTSVWSAAATGTTHVANQSLRTNVFGLWTTWYIKVQIKSSVAKADAGVSNFVVVTTFEHNKGAMAYLDKGTNNITVTFDNTAELQASRNTLHVVYKWKEFDGTDWTIDRSFETYAISSPSTFTINVAGAKVPRTESILMEVTPPPSPCGDVSAPVLNLDATALGSSKIALTWTATDSPCSTDRVAAYDLRYSTAGPITDAATFAAATQVAGLGSPRSQGSAESFTLTGLAGSTTYYFAIKVRTLSGTMNAISNVATATTTEPDVIPPQWVGNLVGRPSKSSGGVDLTWAAPADYGVGGVGPFTCTSYDLRYSSSPILYNDGGASWNAATKVAGLSAPQAPGVAESFTVTGLTGGTTYYFCLKATDDSGNVSDVSNAAPGKASSIGEKTLQVGVNGYTGCTDSYYFVGNTNNYYTQERMVVSGFGVGNYQRGILRFDLSSIPAGATINKATLSLYSYYPAQTKGSAGTYGVYPITAAWTDSQCTWTLAKTGTNWTNPGGDILAAPDATSPKQGTAAMCWYPWNVTARVQTWLAGTSTNNGWIVKCTDESLSDQDYFYQSDTVQAAYRPKLVISDMVTPLVGDITGDGHDDVMDLLALANSWGAACGVNRGFDPRCDLNSDGSVDVVDLLLLADNWGR